MPSMSHNLRPTSLNESDELLQGLLFTSKDDVQMAVKLYSLLRHQEFLVKS